MRLSRPVGTLLLLGILGLVALFVCWRLDMAGHNLGTNPGKANDLPGGDAKGGEPVENAKLLLALPNDVVIVRSAIRSVDGETAVTTVRRLDLALECTLPTAASALNVKLQPDTTGAWETLVWTGRAQMAVHVGGELGDGRFKFRQSLGFGLNPSHTPGGYSKPAHYPHVFSMPREPRRGGVAQEYDLIISSDNGNVKLPIGRHVIRMGFVIGDGPYGIFQKLAVRELKAGNGTWEQRVSLVVVNGEKMEIMTEIPLPEGLTTGGISYVVDAKNLVVVAVELDLDWLMVIELPHVKK